LIPQAIVDEVKRLLAEDQLSQRKIAARLSISRGSVSNIAHGRRPDYAARKRDDEPAFDPDAPKVRCTQCGAMAVMPCLACRDRAATAGRRKFSTLEDNRALQLNLRPEHRARYEAVRRQRIEMETQNPRGPAG